MKSHLFNAVAKSLIDNSHNTDGQCFFIRQLMMDVVHERFSYFVKVLTSCTRKHRLIFICQKILGSIKHKIYFVIF